MSEKSKLDMNTLEDGVVRVCLTEDGFTECCTVSSMHLAPKKEKQLRAAILKKSLNRLFE